MGWLGYVSASAGAWAVMATIANNGIIGAICRMRVSFSSMSMMLFTPVHRCGLRGQYPMRSCPVRHELGAQVCLQPFRAPFAAVAAFFHPPHWLFSQRNRGRVDHAPA